MASKEIFINFVKFINERSDDEWQSYFEHTIIKLVKGFMDSIEISQPLRNQRGIDPEDNNVGLSY